MAKPTRKQKEVTSKYDFQSVYSINEGAKLVKDSNTTKFDASVDLAVNLGVDPKKADQMVRGTVSLPHGTGKTPTVLVLCTPEKEQEAKDAGADHVGLDEYLKKIEGGWTDIDVIITQPSLMPKVAKLGKIIGPKGLMPNPKSDTVTQDIGRAVKEVKAGKVSFRVDKYGIIHASVGRVSFAPEKIKENANELLTTIQRLKPATTKGTYIKNITLSSTMGKGISIDKDTVLNA